MTKCNVRWPDEQEAIDLQLLILGLRPDQYNSLKYLPEDRAQFEEGMTKQLNAWLDQHKPTTDDQRLGEALIEVMMQVREIADEEDQLHGVVVQEDGKVVFNSDHAKGWRTRSTRELYERRRSGSELKQLGRRLDGVDQELGELENSLTAIVEEGGRCAQV